MPSAVTCKRKHGWISFCVPRTQERISKTEIDCIRNLATIKKQEDKNKRNKKKKVKQKN